MPQVISIPFDDYNNYQMGHLPQAYMDTLLEQLRDDPSLAIELMLDSSEVAYYLVLSNGKLHKAALTEDGQFQISEEVSTVR